MSILFGYGFDPPPYTDSTTMLELYMTKYQRKKVEKFYKQEADNINKLDKWVWAYILELVCRDCLHIDQMKYQQCDLKFLGDWINSEYQRKINPLYIFNKYRNWNIKGFNEYLKCSSYLPVQHGTVLKLNRNKNYTIPRVGDLFLGIIIPEKDDFDKINYIRLIIGGNPIQSHFDLDNPLKLNVYHCGYNPIDLTTTN